MEPPAPGPGLGAGERARGQPEGPGEPAGAGPPGGRPAGMESWQSLNVEVDNSQSLLAARLNVIREEGDLSEFPSVEEGLLTILEEDGRERTGEASCSPLLATEEPNSTPHFPLLASSLTHRVWNETLLQQSELEFTPLSSLSTDPQNTFGIGTTISYDTSSSCPYLPHQQAFIDLNKKSASSHDTCHELSRSYRADSVDSLAPVSQRRWETSRKPETFPVRQGQSTLADDSISPLDCKFSHSSLLPCLEKNRLGFSSSLDSSFCESLKYKNLEEYKMSPKLESLKSDESKAKRLGDLHSPLFKGELSSKFMFHSLFPMSSQDQPIQNPLGLDVDSVKLSVHNGSTRKESSDVTFHSGSQLSVKSKLDDMLKPSPKESLDTTETVALHEIVTSVESTARTNNSTAGQNLLDVELDWKQKISHLSSHAEKSSPGQLTQPTYQSTPSLFLVQNLTPEASPKSISVTSKLQSPFISPNELAEPNPRNHAHWKSQSPSHNQEVSSRSMPLPSSDTKDTSEDLPHISPLTQTYSPTLLNILHHDNSCDYKTQGEASQPLASFKDNTLRTNGLRKDDTDIKTPQLSESGIISSGRVAEMLREEKYNINDLPETGELLQNPPDPFGGSEVHSGLPDHFQDGASEHDISPLTFSQTKSYQNPSTTDNKSASAEALFANAEVKEYEDGTSPPPPPEKKVYHHFIDSLPFVPGSVTEPQLLCPNTLRIFCTSPKITSNIHSNLSGISHVSRSVLGKFHSRQETSQHSDSKDKTVSQVERMSQQQEKISESTPEASPKSEQAEEKDISPAIPSAHLSYKEDFKIISKRVQKLIDHWDSHPCEVSAHTLPMVTPMPTSMNKDGKKVKPTLSDIKELSESGSETDKGFHTLLVEAEDIAWKQFTNSPSLYSPTSRLTRLDNNREASLSKDSMVGLSQKSVWDEKVTPTTKVDTNLDSHFTSQRGTRKTCLQEMESKARVALKETLRQYETVQSTSRCEPDRSSAFLGEDVLDPVRPFTSSNSSSDSSETRVSYLWDPVSESCLGYLPHTPSHMYLGDVQERELISDSDDGRSSEDSLAAHVRHLLKWDPPGSFATQMLRNAEEEESRVRARAWNLKLNLATECGESVTELNEDDLRKMKEIKASLFGCGRPLDFFQGLPCPVGIRNISETLCEHVFIEAHEKDCFRSMAHEQLTSPSQDFRCDKSPEIDQRQSTASWNALCANHVKSTVETSKSKAWRSGSHQLFPCSSLESPCVNMGPTRSFPEEMETRSVESVGPAAVSSPAPISLSSHPPSGLCFETLRCSQFSSDAPLVLQADQGQSSPAVAQRSLLASKSPPPTSVKTLASSLRKDPMLTGNEHSQVSIDSSVATKRFQEKEPPASPSSKTPDELQSTIKESQPSDGQNLARGVSLSSLGVGVNGVAESPSGISPEEQARHYQPSHAPPADNRVGLGCSSQNSLSQPQGNTEGKEDRLKQKSHSSNVADVEAESNITVCPNSPAPGGAVSPSPSLSSSPKQRAVSYLRITLSPKASKAKLNDEALKKRQQALKNDPRTRLNDSGNVSAWTSKPRSLVPLESAPQELTSLPDEKECLNRKHHKTSQPSKSFSRQTQVNISDLDVSSHSKEVQNSRECETSDHFRKAVSANSFKLSSDAITQITTESSEKTTLSSEIFINSQAHNIINKPPHCPTAPLSLLPYKPSGSAEMYYVPNSAEPLQYPATRSETTLESSHSGSNDAIAPDFPTDVLGKRDENVSSTVTIKHKEGIYSKKTVRKSAWTEERNSPQEKISESKNQLELENTTHSVFKSAQFYFHNPVHHHHDHDFFSCCEPWGRGTCLTHSRGDFFPFADKDHCFSPPYETSEGEHQCSPLKTEMDYTRFERYCWNLSPDRKLGSQPRLEENLTVGSKVSSTKETSRIHFSLSKTLEPSVTLNELWNRFQERQKKQKPSGSKSLDELSLVDRLDRLAKVLQKPMMFSLQASESAQRKKKGENEPLSSHQSSSSPQSPGGLAGGDQMKPGQPRQLGLDSVSLVSSDSGPSSEPTDPGSESDASVQTDGEAGLFGEVSSDLSIIDPAQISMYESPKWQQQHSSGRQREGSRRVAKWKKSPPASPQVRRKGLQVDSVISLDSISTVSRAWSPTPKNKQTLQMLNKAVQTGELEIVRSTRKHTRDFGVTFPTPSYNAAGTRVDKYVNCSSPGNYLEEKKSMDIYLWTKKPRRSKAHCCEGVSWFIPAENLRCASKKENQASGVSGPSVSWFASLTHTKPWRQPLREKNWQTDDGDSSRLQAAPPILRDDQESQKRFVKGGLQESLERYRPDFISRSGARVKRLRLIMEERKLQCLLQRERDKLFNTVEQQMESQDITSFLSRKGYVTKKNRTITKKEMVQRSKRIYEQLPEVRKRREEEQRKSAYTTYRYKAQLYKMKITNRVLGRKVPWD
ncbi:centrosome-associated protein ALMS1 [Macrotis lagotis]|uniref:centrosome-associated protein ALMS1 n=1 Tax=Macrotis lagotis TaxID=92651 RepID=UPI003D68A72E